jgi:hypothetical protein
VTSDARASQLIRDYFAREWPRICPDAAFATSGPPAPREQVFVHLEVDLSPELGGELSRTGWIYLRCWVPRVLQVSGTQELHRAAREVMEGVRIPSDDGTISIYAGERIDIGRDGRWWMSVITFPFALA